jgi:hypothetical protein
MEAPFSTSDDVARADAVGSAEAVREGRDEVAELGAGEGGGGGSIEEARESQGNHRGGREVVRSKENQRDGRKEDGLFDVRKKIASFLTYHGFLTITSSSRIISLD